MKSRYAAKSRIAKILCSKIAYKQNRFNMPYGRFSDTSICLTDASVTLQYASQTHQ